MTAPTTKPPALLPFDASHIPEALRAQKRWAPWRAVFDAKRGKYDKVPVRAGRPEWGLSTANPAQWAGFAEATLTHAQAHGATAGVGYVMTRPHGIVGVDLDDAFDGPNLAPWAVEIVERLGGYAEVSPSGRGARVFVRGEIPTDWCNHEIGVEVYAGHAPRFLTVTGKRLPGSAADVPPAPPGVFDWLAEKYKRSDRAPSLTARDAPEMPEVLPLSALPPDDDLFDDLPPQACDFLRDGDFATDRSRTLHSTAVSLFAAGHQPQQVLSILAHNHHAMEVALDHRRHDVDRALVYLWVEHCCKAAPKAESRIARDADFADFDALAEDYAADVLAEDEPPAAQAPDTPGEAAEGDFEDLSGGSPAQAAASPPKPEKAERFKFLQAAEYCVGRKRLDWFIPGVLPKAELCAVFGASGAGKTFFTLDMVARIAQGLPWWGKRTRQTRVAYVVAEGATGFQDRMTAWCGQNGVDLGDLDLYGLPDAPNFLEKQDVIDLVRQLRKLEGLGLVVVDTLAQVTPGASENSSEDMGRALTHCKQIHKHTGATVLLVGHSGKDAGRGLRGWSGIKGALDAEIEVTKTATYRAATITKLKDGRGEGAEYPFQLVDVLVEEASLTDPDAEEIYSCVIEPMTPDAVVEVKAKSGVNSLGDNERILYDQLVGLADYIEDGGVKETDLLNASKEEYKIRNDGKTPQGHQLTRSLESLMKKGYMRRADGPDGKPYLYVSQPA